MVMSCGRRRLAFVAVLCLLLAAWPGPCAGVPAAFSSRGRTHSQQARLEPDYMEMPVSAAAPEFRFQQASSAPPKPTTGAQLPDYNVGCMDVPFAVCVGTPETGGLTAFAADAVHKGLVGHWTFDDSAAQDQSGYMNTLKPVPPAGPGRGGRGASAFLNRTHPYKLAHQPAYSSKELTVAFWIYLLGDSMVGYSVIFNKGHAGGASPSIALVPQHRNLLVSYTTLSGHGSIQSKSSVPLRRWTHVAYVQENRIVTLYINGKQDSEVVVPAPGILPNDSPVWIGNDPWHSGVYAYLDDLRIFSRALSPSHIQAYGALAYSAINPTDVTLACSNCPLVAAKQKCALQDGFHLCSRGEQQQGALAVAASLGWFTLKDTYVWHATSTASPDVALSTAALCCKD